MQTSSKRTQRTLRRDLSIALMATVILGGASACGDEQVPGGPLGQDQNPNSPAPGGDGDGNGDGDGDGQNPGGGGQNPTDPPITVQSKWCDALAALRTNCQECHSAKVESTAPMPLDTYEDLMKPAITDPKRKVYQLVGERIHDADDPMPEPPRVMSDADKAAIDAWIADGAQPGPNTACSEVPTPDPDPDGGDPVEEEWPEDCEEVYSIRAGNNGQPHTVRAGVEEHPQFYFDAPWGDDPVQAVAFKPITDNKKVIHHWILYENGGSASGIGGAFLTGWSPGKDDIRTFPDDIGVYLPSGSDVLRLDTHYYNLGGTGNEQDQSGVDICITRNPREHTAGTHAFGTVIFSVASGEKKDVVSNCSVRTNGGSAAYLLASSPHMHKLGYWAKLSRTRGGVETMLHDAAFDFEFQDFKSLDRVELKTGDTVTTVCSFENTTGSAVRFGQDTDDEMCFNFALYYPRGAFSCSGGFGF